MTISSIRRATPLVGVASLALVLAACGGDDTTDTTTDATTDPGTEETTAGGDLSGQLSGAGASSQAAAMQAWQAGIQAINPDLTVNYDPVGSGGGREQFTAGGIAFAGSDAALDEEERAGRTSVAASATSRSRLHLPVAVAFNLPGIDSLNMDATLIANIFNQQVTTWDDPAIAELNPDVELPSSSITPVNRSDESGTTENFDEYLFAAAPDDWPYEPSGVWPVSGGEAAQGTSGVVRRPGPARAPSSTPMPARSATWAPSPSRWATSSFRTRPRPRPRSSTRPRLSRGCPGRRPRHRSRARHHGSGVYPIVLVSYTSPARSTTTRRRPRTSRASSSTSSARKASRRPPRRRLRADHGRDAG